MNDIKAQAEFDRLCAAANAARIREDFSEAERLAYKALELRPNDVKLMEFIGDMLAAQGRKQEALAQYKRLYESDKSLRRIEEKYAKLLIDISEEQYERERLQDMLANPQKYRHQMRNPIIAVILSLAPGFGHIYLGQTKKGVIVLASAFFCWAACAATLPQGLEGSTTQRIQQFVQQITIAPIVFGLAGFMLSLYSLIDTAVISQKMQYKEKENKLASINANNSSL